ncbi:hypothetical protein FRC09_011614 [Ceratobasidium sp. 395]|nr:hypothetical protein FRC09_011614 [Ceratobasidium sp. 395]
MIFSLVSLIYFVFFFLPLTVLAAPAAPAFELESRANKTHKVIVGRKGGKLRYEPQYVYAKTAFMFQRTRPRTSLLTSTMSPM